MAKKVYLQNIELAQAADIPVVPTLAAVATSGSYNDLVNTPTIPDSTSDLTNDSNFVSDATYVHTDNNYTTTEKNKLANIAAGAEVNVQSDWNVTSTTSDAFIKNKPSIPSKTSDLTNDSNFVADSAYVHTDNNYTTTEKSKLEGIAAGAEVNQNAFSYVRVGTTTLAADDESDTLSIAAGSNITLNASTSNDTFTISATDTTYSNATTSTAGLMSATDKSKLDGLATVASTGSYNDLVDRPSAPSLVGYVKRVDMTAAQYAALATKDHDTLYVVE